MNQEQARNMIIVVIAGILVAGGIYFYQKGEEGSPTDENITGGEQPSVEQGNTEEDSITSGDGSGGKITNTNPAIELQAKYKVAVEKAQIAFRNGDYAGAVKYYEEALKYLRTDDVYAGMYTAYSAQKDWVKARSALDSAISLNSKNADYWKWKLTLLDEETQATYSELKQLYQDGLARVDSRLRINLVVHFASIAENNQQYQEAIAVWEKAKELNPLKSAVYQAEIDRLKSL